MNTLLSKSIVALFFSLVAIVASAEDGANTTKYNLFVFVFKEGVAQKDIEVQVGDTKAITDAFGNSRFALPADDYEVGYFKNGELFAITDVSLLNSVSSQIFLNLSKKGADVELDLPLSAFEQNFELEAMKKQTGPKGKLKLLARDSVTQELIAGGKLFFKGYAIDAFTNENGEAEVELAEGEYDISIVHPKYVMQVLKDVKVKANETSTEDILLVKADIVLDEFVVSAPFVEGSLASNIAELKDSDVVGDAISSEQFSKAGDSDAAGALKRVTGITIIDDKFVFVRGLGERYSTVLLNDLEVPSPEPTKRVVPLDIFPAGVIQSMDIQKTWSSDLPGTFGGGTILINTKDIPEEDNYISGSVSISLNQYTGEDVISNPDNDKPLPAIVTSLTNGFTPLDDQLINPITGDVLREGITPEERIALDSAVATYRSFGIKQTKLDPGTSLSTSFGQSFKTSGGMKYGFAGNLYYKYEAKSSGDVEEVILKSDGTDISVDRESTSDKTTLSEKYGGLISFGIEPNKDHKLKYTFLGLLDAEEQTKFSDQTDVTELGEKTDKYLLRYTEKELFTHQLNGNHLFGEEEGSLFDGLDLNWGYSVSSATRIEPGTFEYEYKEADPDYTLDKDSLFFQYSELEDDVDNYRVDLALPFKMSGRKNKIEVGYYSFEKERSLDNRRLNFDYASRTDTRDIDDIINETAAIGNDLKLTSNFLEDDAYTAEQELSALHAKVLLSPINQLDLLFGVRKEESTQDLAVGIRAENIVNYSLETSDTLPFFSGTYRFDDEHQIRFGYSETVSRPDFREFSTNRYKDPETDYIVRGSDELTYTEITNIDFKYEWFPSFDEFYSFGLFSKDFTNPIETLRAIVDEEIEISYANAKGASSLGFELGARKNLDGLLGDLEHYFVEANYAWIDSEVELRQEDIEKNNLTTNERPMQGQSPYVANLKFGYDNFFTRRSAMFLYNVFGERITALGINETGDIYEQPFHRLDFVVKWGLNDTYDEQEKKIGYTVSLKLKNLLDQDKERTQNGRVVDIVRPGRSATIGFSMKF